MPEENETLPENERVSSPKTDFFSRVRQVKERAQPHIDTAKEIYNRKFNYEPQYDAIEAVEDGSDGEGAVLLAAIAEEVHDNPDKFGVTGTFGRAKVIRDNSELTNEDKKMRLDRAVDDLYASSDLVRDDEEEGDPLHIFARKVAQREMDFYYKGKEDLLALENQALERIGIAAIDNVVSGHLNNEESRREDDGLFLPVADRIKIKREVDRFGYELFCKANSRIKECKPFSEDETNRLLDNYNTALSKRQRDRGLEDEYIHIIRESEELAKDGVAAIDNEKDFRLLEKTAKRILNPNITPQVKKTIKEDLEIALAKQKHKHEQLKHRYEGNPSAFDGLGYGGASQVLEFIKVDTKFIAVAEEVLNEADLTYVHNPRRPRKLEHDIKIISVERYGKRVHANPGVNALKNIPITKDLEALKLPVFDLPDDDPTITPEGPPPPNPMTTMSLNDLDDITRTNEKLDNDIKEARRRKNSTRREIARDRDASVVLKTEAGDKAENNYQGACFRKNKEMTQRFPVGFEGSERYRELGDTLEGIHKEIDNTTTQEDKVILFQDYEKLFRERNAIYDREMNLVLSQRVFEIKDKAVLLHKRAKKGSKGQNPHTLALELHDFMLDHIGNGLGKTSEKYRQTENGITTTLGELHDLSSSSGEDRLLLRKQLAGNVLMQYREFRGLLKDVGRKRPLEIVDRQEEVETPVPEYSHGSANHENGSSREDSGDTNGGGDPMPSLQTAAERMNTEVRKRRGLSENKTDKSQRRRSSQAKRRRSEELRVADRDVQRLESERPVETLPGSKQVKVDLQNNIPLDELRKQAPDIVGRDGYQWSQRLGVIYQNRDGIMMHAGSASDRKGFNDYLLEQKHEHKKNEDELPFHPLAERRLDDTLEVYRDVVALDKETHSDNDQGETQPSVVPKEIVGSVNGSGYGVGELRAYYEALEAKSSFLPPNDDILAMDRRIQFLFTKIDGGKGKPVDIMNLKNVLLARDSKMQEMKVPVVSD